MHDDELPKVGNVSVGSVSNEDSKQNTIQIPKKKIPKQIIFFGIISIVVIILVVGYIKYIKAPYTQVQLNSQNQTAQTTPVPNESISNSENILPKVFSKRLFNPDKIFADNLKYYPEEFVDAMLAYREDDLEELKCVDVWDDNGEGKYVYRPEGTTLNLNVKDAEIQMVVNRVKSIIDPEKTLLSLSICQKVNNNYIVRYGIGIFPEAFIMGPKQVSDFIASINDVGNLSIPILITERESGMYYGCGGVLQLSKTGIIYLECGVGEGTGGTSWFYEIDMNKKISKLVNECDYDSATPAKNCK